MASDLLDVIARNGKAFQDTEDEVARRKTITAARALIASLENPAEQLARIGWGEPTRTAALQVAFELGLLEKLNDKPMSSTRLAEGTKASPEIVARVIKHLASFHLVKEAGRDQYVATAFTKATSDPTIHGGLIYSFDGMIPTFHGLPAFLAKTDYAAPSNPDRGPVQFGLHTDVPFFEILKSNQRLGGAFNNFMAGYGRGQPSWTDYYPCGERLGSAEGQAPLVVDVGGGLGGQIATLHAKHPELKGRLVLQDQQPVIEQAQKADPPLAAAIEPRVHDFFTPQPEDCRSAGAYFLRLILHDWPDEKCTVILSNIRDAMKKGHSKLLINDMVLKDTGAPWQQTSLDWVMMGLLCSRERTETQWAKLLASAGLKVNKIFDSETAREATIEAVLADE